MPEPALSVVVPTRGGVRRLPVLLDALAAQSLDEPWEVVVVLDGDVAYVVWTDVVDGTPQLKGIRILAASSAKKEPAKAG